MPKKGTIITNGRHARGKVRPHVWKYGTDPRIHEIHNAFGKAKAQADFRNEGWELTFEEYYKLWDPFWHNRGRRSEQMCMSRKDYSKAWNLENCVIVTRLEHLQQQNHYRKTLGMKYKTGTHIKYTNLKRED